jgi:hypothetical protein
VIESYPQGGSLRRLALEGRTRPPYIGWRALGYKPVSIYPSWLKNPLDCLDLHSKLSSCPWTHMSGRGGSTDRSAGLLVGRARQSGTAETLGGGDPWVLMSLT